MNINVSCHDLFEVKYLNDRNEEDIVFESHFDSVKDFIKTAKNKHFSVLSITYYIKIMISRSDSHISNSPDKRFAEHRFSPEEFLTISNSWVKETRESANPDIDHFMTEHYGASLS